MPQETVDMRQLTIHSIVFFILTLSIGLQAQTQHPRVRVLSKSFYQYEMTKEIGACEDLEVEDTSRSRCAWIVAYNYPFVKTPDEKLSQLINAAVRNTFDHTGPSAKRQNISSKCPEDKPGEDLMNYSIHYQDNSFLSFTVYKDYEPSGFGNGFRHDALPFTFDLEKTKQLVLADVVKKECDTIIRRIILSQIKRSNPDLFSEFGEVNNPSLFQPFQALNFSFALTQKSVIVYYPLSFGGKYAFEEIQIKFSENSALFSDQRILNLRQRTTK